MISLQLLKYPINEIFRKNGLIIKKYIRLCKFNPNNTKTALVSIYQKKYRAKVAVGLKMYIDEIQGEKLIKQYLNTDSDIKIDIEDE